MSLWDLPADKTAEITSIDQLEPNIRQRMADLGFRPGDQIKCLRKTPFGAPRPYIGPQGTFSIEKDIAQLVTIQEISQ